MIDRTHKDLLAKKNIFEAAKSKTVQKKSKKGYHNHIDPAQLILDRETQDRIKRNMDKAGNAIPLPPDYPKLSESGNLKELDDIITLYNADDKHFSKLLTFVFNAVETGKFDPNFRENYKVNGEKMKDFLKTEDFEAFLNRYIENAKKEVKEFDELLEDNSEKVAMSGQALFFEEEFGIYSLHVRKLLKYMELMNTMGQNAYNNAKAENELTEKLEMFVTAKISTDTKFTPDNLGLSTPALDTLSVDNTQDLNDIKVDLSKIAELYRSKVLIRMYKTVENKQEKDGRKGRWDSKKFRENYTVNDKLLQKNDNNTKAPYILEKRDYREFLTNYSENAKDRRMKVNRNDSNLEKYKKEIKNLRMYMELMKAAAEKLEKETLPVSYTHLTLPTNREV